MAWCQRCDIHRTKGGNVICKHCKSATQPRTRPLRGARSGQHVKDLTTAEIERTFTAALTEIRRRRSIGAP
jgi:hypothetical protein